MSYCRWSDLYFTCDLYCYEAKEGYITHIATQRRMGPMPVFPWFDPDFSSWSSEKLFAKHQKYQDGIDSAGKIPIDLPLDGESFCDADIEDFYDRLLRLREMGYNFPDEVIQDVEWEIKSEGEEQ